MKPIRLLLAACLLAQPMHAVLAADWQLVLSDRNRRIEIDRDSILSSDAGTKISWGRVVLTTDEARSAGYAMIKALNRYDCRNRSFTTIKRVYVDAADNILREEAVDGASVMVTPNSVDERMWREVCDPPSAAELLKLANEAARLAAPAAAPVANAAPAPPPARPAAAVPPAAPAAIAVAPATVQPPVSAPGPSVPPVQPAPPVTPAAAPMPPAASAAPAPAPVAVAAEPAPSLPEPVVRIPAKFASGTIRTGDASPATQEAQPSILPALPRIGPSQGAAAQVSTPSPTPSPTPASAPVSAPAPRSEATASRPASAAAVAQPAPRSSAAAPQRPVARPPEPRTPVRTEPVRPRLPADGGAAERARIARAAEQSVGERGGVRVTRPALEPSWSYAGETGPEHWAALRPEWRLCAEGRRQSPIDLRDGIAVDLAPVEFDYRRSGFRIRDTGNTLQVDVGEGLGIVVRGTRYALERFTLHRPSQDRIGGMAHDMAMYLEHRSEDGQVAILSLLLEAGDTPNEVLQTIFNNLPLDRGRAFAPDAVLDLPSMVPSNPGHFLYIGSLPAPPCTEDVLWVVMKQPVPISHDQLAVFARLYPRNGRPIQPHNGRLLLESR
ncbi:carbonic anhydrase family protein [Thauera mechernichensis]